MKVVAPNVEPKRRPSLEPKAPAEGSFRRAEESIFRRALRHHLAERLGELLADWSHFSVADDSVTNFGNADDFGGGPRQEDLISVVQVFKMKRPFQY